MRAGPVAALVLAALAVVPGCARRESPAAAAARDQVLLFGNGSEPGSLDPNLNAAAVESTIDSALFEGLTNIGIDGVTILPGVAERWDVTPDRLTYTFHLRADARWSDGSPVTADDFVFSFRRVFNPEIACPTADAGFAIAGSNAYVSGRSPSPDSLGVRALGPRTLEVRLEHPAPYFLYVVGGAPFLPVPRAVVERFGGAARPDSAWSRPGNLVSNGAFVLQSWVANAAVTVVRNPLYWDRAHVHLAAVRFLPIDNADTEERTFRAGGLHLTYRVPLSKLAAYRESRDPRFQVSPILGTWYVIFNTTRPPFDRAVVRRAFSLVINRDTLVPRILHESGTPAHSLTRPGTAGYTPPSLPDFDPDLGRRLLAEAGYPGGRGFPAAEFMARNAGSDPEVAEALQEIWHRELGVPVRIAQLEPKVAISSFESHDFTFGINGYFYTMQSPEFILTVARGNSPPNSSGWASAVFDQDFRTAEEAVGEREHAAAVDALEARIHAEVPYAPLYFYNQCQLVHPLLKGWRGNLLQQTDWRELTLGGSPAAH